MSGPRVHDGKDWIPVSDVTSEGIPVQPTVGEDGTIFVSIPSYRDGERCGETLKSLFENAVHPEKVVVGLVEQNAPEDQFCLEVYCDLYGANTNERKTVREGVVKIMTNGHARETCPHYDQVRVVAYHHIQAKGPILARSMARKALGNEEFCMQVDAHTDFAKGWDEIAKSEWIKTGNEFGIISAVPADKAMKDTYAEGGEKFTEVPRQCAVRFLENGFPDYATPADGRVVDLEKPLLGHTWSSAFSFAKCHLEESAPYDNFSLYAKPIEQFSRFARFWTRGYDVYTPTRNIAFHDYGPQANGHGDNEWFKRQRDRFRKMSLDRVKTTLQMAGGHPAENDQANLGIYGLGKRRSLEQLSKFVNINLANLKGNVRTNMKCTGHEWVKYDESISPTENLFSNPDDLDPQPEYPLRTDLVYYQQVRQVIPVYEVDGDPSTLSQRQLPAHGPDSFGPVDTSTNMPSVGVLLVFWIFGLMVWCIMFMFNPGVGKGRSPGRKKSPNVYKDV